MFFKEAIASFLILPIYFIYLIAFIPSLRFQDFIVLKNISSWKPENTVKLSTKIIMFRPIVMKNIILHICNWCLSKTMQKFRKSTNVISGYFVKSKQNSVQCMYSKPPPATFMFFNGKWEKIKKNIFARKKRVSLPKNNSNFLMVIRYGI